MRGENLRNRAQVSERSALDVAQSWLQTAESTVISDAGAVLEFGRSLLSVVNLFGELSNAYNSCS